MNLLSLVRASNLCLAILALPLASAEMTSAQDFDQDSSARTSVPTLADASDLLLTGSYERAIEAYTLGPAYASFEEGIKGSITVGKLADLVVLSRDLLTATPTEILETKVLHTVVGGRIVYSAD